ncbi:secreted RxLR effector protein 161-like [Pistacia vera]|uniref:secreted RxLR effector protein 161-like n=1 Tax=Pistacia vera TaxID=55513 RepID=UPI00126341D2|nr:secreted RxLR effector protein 161-like [Pistacia vera]
MENIPYTNVIGSTMYVMISTRPDLAFAISLLSRYMSNPGIEHWVALEWLLRYINSSVHVGLDYCKRNIALDLVGYVDSDFAGDRDTRKSTTAYYFTLGGNYVSWKSQLQPLVALSTTEAEYMAVTNTFKEANWLQGILKEANLLEGLVTVYSDSQSVIHLCKNPVYHERTKHVDVRFHFVRDRSHLKRPIEPAKDPNRGESR